MFFVWTRMEAQGETVNSQGKHLFKKRLCIALRHWVNFETKSAPHCIGAGKRAHVLGGGGGGESKLAIFRAPSAWMVHWRAKKWMRAIFSSLSLSFPPDQSGQLDYAKLILSLAAAVAAFYQAAAGCFRCAFSAQPLP
jgi:hypothetical protein